MSNTSSRLVFIEQIDALLPQTQCGKCGTPNCRAYAEAVADGTPINRCVPGGAATIADLAAFTGQAALPLDPAFGIEPDTHRVAWIREAECIGCTKCIQACPVDAIVGAAKLMHTVIQAECNGCDLCILACPVDCIDVQHLPKITDKTELRRLAQHYRHRYQRHLVRWTRTPNPASEATLPSSPSPAKPAVSPTVAAALLRNRLKKAEKQRLLAQEKGESVEIIETEIRLLQEALAAFV